MLTFDNWLEMQSNGLYSLLQEFKKAPIYSEFKCCLMLADKYTICVFADEQHMKLGCKTIQAMLKEKHLERHFRVLCRYTGDVSGLIDIDALISQGLDVNWNKTFDNLLCTRVDELELLKVVLKHRPESKVCLTNAGITVCIPDKEAWLVDLVKEIPELNVLYQDESLYFSVSSNLQPHCATALDITKEIKGCLS